MVDLSHVFKRQRALKERSAEQEYAGETSHKHRSLSTIVFLKHAANLRGHVLEDTAEVLHSLARTSFGGRGISSLIFVEKNLFEKVIEKEHFGVILQILLVKPPSKTKNVYSSNREKKI